MRDDSFRVHFSSRLPRLLTASESLGYQTCVILYSAKPLVNQQKNKSTGTEFKLILVFLESGQLSPEPPMPVGKCWLYKLLNPNDRDV